MVRMHSGDKFGFWFKCATSCVNINYFLSKSNVYYMPLPIHRHASYNRRGDDSEISGTQLRKICWNIFELEKRHDVLEVNICRSRSNYRGRREGYYYGEGCLLANVMAKHVRKRIYWNKSVEEDMTILCVRCRLHLFQWAVVRRAD